MKNIARTSYPVLPEVEKELLANESMVSDQLLTLAGLENHLVVRTSFVQRETILAPAAVNDDWLETCDGQSIVALTRLDAVGTVRLPSEVAEVEFVTLTGKHAEYAMQLLVSTGVMFVTDTNAETALNCEISLKLIICPAIGTTLIPLDAVPCAGLITVTLGV